MAVQLISPTGDISGGDAVGFMRKHHDRVSYLDLKNVDGSLQRRAQAEKMSFVDAVKMGVLTEPSDGSIDFREFGAVLREVGYDGWATVEQDMYEPPLDKPPPSPSAPASTCMRSVSGDGRVGGDYISAYSINS